MRPSQPDRFPTLESVRADLIHLIEVLKESEPNVIGKISMLATHYSHHGSVCYIPRQLRER